MILPFAWFGCDGCGAQACVEGDYTQVAQPLGWTFEELDGACLDLCPAYARFFAVQSEDETANRA